MNKKVYFKSFEARVVDDNYVEGYASTFGNVDKVGDIVEKGAFSKTLVARKEAVRFLWQHDTTQPIGRVVEMREDERGLWFKAVFASTQAGQDARKALLEGVVDRFSIGYQVIQQKADTLNGRRVNRLKELRLLEVSLVTFPANEEAVAVAVKAVGDGVELNDTNKEFLARFASFLLAEQEAANENEPAEQDEPEAESDPADEAPAEGEEPANDDVAQDEDAEKAISDALLLLKLDALARALKG